jgi:hypothetical protein
MEMLPIETHLVGTDDCQFTVFGTPKRYSGPPSHGITVGGNNSTSDMVGEDETSTARLEGVVVADGATGKDDSGETESSPGSSITGRLDVMQI